MTSATRVVLLVVSLMATVPPGSQAQTNGTPRARPGDDSVVVRASEKYGASGFHRFWLGDNYRDLWYQSIKVPVLDLGKYAGGLKALEEGGNAQTRNLHLRGADGKEYVFRPVFKEVLELDDMFDHTIIGDVFADGLSASHPAATVLASPFLEAGKVLHASPRLFVMPDDERLGEFRRNFANKLGTIEEFPEDPKEEPGFGGAVDIIDSDELLEQLNKDGPPIIDAHALLTARLIDLLIGDNDRHPGQWKWAKLRNAPNAKWVPIPRDRDKAFVSYEGALLKAARIFLPRLVSFKTQPHAAMFYNAVDFDRRLLVPLERQDFDSTARFLVSVITDSVINEAARSLPAEYRKIEPELTGRLRARRDHLVESVADYYHALFAVADLHGTIGDDQATIVRKQDGTIDMRLEARGVTYLDRNFDKVTREIRVYLHDGDDVARVTGNVPGSIPLWIVGGSGRNTLADSSTVGGRKRTRVYDNGGISLPNAVVTGATANGKPEPKADSGNNALDRDKKKGDGEGDERDAGKEVKGGYDPDTAWSPRPFVHFQRYDVPPFRDRGTSLRPMATISFGHGYGVKPAISLTRRKFGFRQYPYASKTKLEVAYGTAMQGWGAELTTDNRFESSRMFFATENALTQLLTGRFRGFGNDATLADGVSDDVNQGQWYIKPAIGWALGPQTEVKFGPVAKFTNTDSTAGTFVAESQPYGFRRFGLAGFELSFLHESRRRVVSHGSTADELLGEDPTQALDLEIKASAYPAIWDATSAFGSVSAVASGYVTLPVPLRPMLAMRAGGQQVFGEFPYFESAFLGGSETMRTLHRQQYAGDRSLYGTVELRLPVASFPFIFPLNFGLLGFADAGRVYMDGASPGGWHTGMGGGFWLGTMKPSTNVNFTWTNSRDRKFLIATGFVF
jgi:hypothetical protein